MTPPGADAAFSVRVSGERWRAEAEAWIRENVEQAGGRVEGVEQPRVRPWSTQLVVTTDSGRLWFKAGCRSMAFEPAIQQRLAALAPGAVQAPWRVDAERGWMLTFDHGATLQDHRAPTLEDWQDVLRRAAALQRVVAGHPDALLATGLPDCSPGTVPGRLDRAVDVCRALPDDHRAHLDAETAERLLARRPAVVDASAALAEGPLPTTLQHGDLHPNNVFASLDGGLNVFDFGDAQWAHACEVLSVPYGILSAGDVPWREVYAAYREQWTDTATAAEVDALARASLLTQPVNRFLTWWGCLAEATAAEWQEWGEGPLHHLRNVLEPPPEDFA